MFFRKMEDMKHLIFFILLFTSFYAKAISFEDAIFPELATSSRALAMGNAFIAKADDSSAAFYNPAGLGSVRYPHLHLSNFSFETNKGAIQSATGGTLTSAFSDLTKLESLDGMRTLLNKNAGNIAHFRMHALPNFTTRYFSMGYLYAKRIRAVVNSTTATNGFEFADRLDYGPYAALNFSLFGGIFKFGASGIWLTRKEISTTSDPQATLVLGPNSYSKGTAFVVTSGVKLVLPVTFLPTFAATMHNSLHKTFSAGGAGAPTTIPSSVDFGFSVTPQIGTATRVCMELDYKDFSGAYTGISATRRFLAGLEFDFSRTFFFRLGYGDGFGSAGLGVRSPKLEFDLTTYAVDTTSSAFRGKEDRRFVIGLSSGF